MSYEVVKLEKPILAYSELNKLIKNRAVIAGGYASWFLTEESKTPFEDVVDYSDSSLTPVGRLVPRNVPTDIDIFAYNREYYTELIREFREITSMVAKNVHYASFQGDSLLGGAAAVSHHIGVYPTILTDFVEANIYKRNKIKDLIPSVQVILMEPFKTVPELLERFDFYVCKAAILNENEILVHKNTLRDIKDKVLNLSTPDTVASTPFKVLYRCVKYIQKGYKLNEFQILRIIENADANQLEEANLSKEEFREIVEWLGSYMRGDMKYDSTPQFFERYHEVYLKWLADIRKHRIS